jgi:hypothetical protein
VMTLQALPPISVGNRASSGQFGLRTELMGSVHPPELNRPVQSRGVNRTGPTVQGQTVGPVGFVIGSRVMN